MIDPVSLGFTGPVGVRRNAPSAAAPDSPRSPKTANLSDLAAVSLPRLVSLAAELAAQGPPVDTDRIAQVETAIAMGHLRSDPDAIAAAMISLGEQAWL